MAYLKSQKLFPVFKLNDIAVNEILTYCFYCPNIGEYYTNDEEQILSLFNDILIRDIVTRYGIRDIKSLQRLASYLFSNIGNRISASKLKQALSIGATSTILSWFSHLELSYLVSFLPMFSYSTKAQLINPKKIYAIDLGLIELISNNLTEDIGRKLENLIYLHLRKKYNELFYFDESGECDFVVMQKGNIIDLIQVCYELTPDNLKRELNGLYKAMQFFNIHKGTIITFSNKDFINENGFEINVVPAYDYLIT